MLETVALVAFGMLAFSCGAIVGSLAQRAKRYHPPIGTPGALQEQLHAAMSEDR